MKIIVEAQTSIQEMLQSAELSLVSCNQRDLCMATHG